MAALIAAEADVDSGSGVQDPFGGEGTGDTSAALRFSSGGGCHLGLDDGDRGVPSAIDVFSVLPVCPAGLCVRRDHCG
jgi:hypothetical protein